MSHLTKKLTYTIFFAFFELTALHIAILHKHLPETINVITKKLSRVLKLRTKNFTSANKLFI